MDIRQLHYFLVLCEEMNYTRAAQGQKVVQQGNKDHGAARPFRQKAQPFAQSILL